MNAIDEFQQDQNISVEENPIELWDDFLTECSNLVEYLENNRLKIKKTLK